MKKTCKTATALTLSLTITAVNTANFLQGKNVLNAKATTIVNTANEEPIIDQDTETFPVPVFDNDSSPSQKENQSYFDAETHTLHLKGRIKNITEQDSEYYGLVLPEGVSPDNVYSVVAEKGTILPQNCSNMFHGFSSLQYADLNNADTSNVTDMSSMFKDCLLLEEIDLSSFDTSSVTDMSEMFKNCVSLESLDLTSFDTSSVTDMSEMFLMNSDYYPNYLAKLSSVNLSSFNTSNVSDMSYMFYGCNSLTTLELNNFDTNNVEDMCCMFSFCEKIRSIDISSFNTLNVTDMGGMFSFCYDLESIDISHFNTNKVTIMSTMFELCDSITSLDLRNFDTSNVTSFNGMFAYCESLSYLDLSSFDTSKAIDINFMFSDSRYLKTIVVGESWSIKSTVQGTGMFEYCDSLVGGEGTKYDPDHIDSEYAHIDGGPSAPGYFTAVENNIDKSYFDKTTKTLHLNGYTQNGVYLKGVVLPLGVERTDVEYIVADQGTILPEDCSYFCTNLPNLKSVDFKKADSSNVTNMSNMFYNCKNITSLDLRNFNTSNVTDMSGIFNYCTKLAYLDLSTFNTKNVLNMSKMFAYCNHLKVLDLTNFDTSNVSDMSEMFIRCVSMKSLDISSFNTKKVTNMFGMFAYCKSIKKITVSKQWTTRSATGNSMFIDDIYLRGGAGTAYNSRHTGIEYARIDGGKTAPGYLTIAR